MPTERGNVRLVGVQALSQTYINIFANSATLFRFLFFSKKKSTQSATIVLTLWIHRTEDETKVAFWFSAIAGKGAYTVINSN